MPAKCLNGSISFISGPFIGYQCPEDLLIRVLSWSLFSERGAGELLAGNTRIRSRANKNSSRKGGRIQGGVEAEANLEGPLSQTALPARYFLHDLVTGGTSHNGSRQTLIMTNNKIMIALMILMCYCRFYLANIKAN